MEKVSRCEDFRLSASCAKFLGIMLPTSHLTPEMMKSVLANAFSTSVTQADKKAVRHLRKTLMETHSEYQSVLFDIVGHFGTKGQTALAEMAFLIGLQAGYELGVTYPSPTDRRRRFTNGRF